LTRVPEHVVQRHFCSAYEFFITNLTVQNSASTLVQASDDGALEFRWRDNLHRHDRLKDDRFRLRVYFPEGTDRRDAERQFRGINDVVAAVLENHTTAYCRVTGQSTLFQCFEETLSPSQSANVT